LQPRSPLWEREAFGLAGSLVGETNCPEETATDAAPPAQATDKMWLL